MLPPTQEEPRVRNFGLALLLVLGLSLGLVVTVRDHRLAVDAGDAASVDTATTTSASTGAWIDSLAEALARAKKEKKIVLADFTGTDWCTTCMRLRKEVFEKPEFMDWAAKNAVLLEVDFPNKKKQTDALKAQNKKLLDDNGVEGFPTTLLLDADGKAIGKFEYEEGGPAPYIARVEAIRAGKK
jgi:thiol:disulfide interchange protein